VLCLECGRVDGSIVSARKGARWVRVDARGRAAHAGVEPGAGRNAILALCREAVRASQIEEVQVTEFHGGDFLNTIPGSASMQLAVRGVSEAEIEARLAQIRRAGEYEGVAITVADTGGPPPLERTPAVAGLATEAIRLGAALGHRFGEQITGGVS